ncbi:MAG: AmpG family muropeptide MFS transporter [Gammaproteobacteria bacterium]
MQDNNKLRLNRTAVRRLSILTMLGFSSGLPLALSGTTLQAWFTEAGIDIKTIGMMSLVGLPYVLKFLWAPLVDKYTLPGLDRRKSWMLASQLAIVMTLLLFAVLVPAEHLYFITFLALVLAFFSATQDVAIDAYRAEILEERERGIGVGLAVTAYRLAMIIAGAGALIIADRYGFHSSYACMAVLMSIGILAAFVGPEPGVANASGGLLETFWRPLKVFCAREAWIGLLILVFTYKLGDAFAEKLTTTFLLREVGLTLSELAGFYKTAGIAAAILGGLIGGAIMFKMRLYSAILLFAVLQMITNLGFVLLTITGKNYVAIVSVVIAENLFGGMGTAALIALLMALCDLRYTATQFALLSAIASLGRVLSGPIAGDLAADWGWTWFYTITVVIAALPVIVVPFLKETLLGLESRD